MTKGEAAELAWKADDLGTVLLAICTIQAGWSQRTFGPDTVESVKGPLNHLKREAEEAKNAPHVCLARKWAAPDAEGGICSGCAHEVKEARKARLQPYHY